MTGWKKNIRQVVPYTPGEQPKLSNIIKLNTNENPYPPSPKVSDVMAGFEAEVLKKYPDPCVTKLVDVLAKEHNVSSDMVFTGVGSDDVLGMAFLTCFNSDKPILFPNITYSFYDVWAELFKIPYECPKLCDDFTIRKEDYMVPNGGIVIANPNAPTSILMPLSDVEDIIKANREVVVIIDEAYVDFSGESALPLVDKYDNLLVVRTFSKSRSMAGMRIGYAIGQPELIKAINDVKYSYNSYTMTALSIECGVAAVEDKKYFEETVVKIIETRDVFIERLKGLGFSMPQSKTNFLFVTHERVPAEVLFNELKERKIFVRYFKKPFIDNYLRITVGTDEEMEALVKALDEIINSK